MYSSVVACLAISGGLALSATDPTRLGVGVHYGRDTPGRARS